MKYIFTVFFLLSAWCVNAQAPTEELPASETLDQRVEKLEKRTSTWDKILAHLPTVSGYLQLRYDWREGGTSTFYVKRVRLNLTGEIIRPLTYRVQIEFASSPKLVDTYLQYSPFQQLNVKVGMYKVPFSIENTDYAPLRLELIEYPLVLARMMGLNDVSGLKTTGRDTGATLFGGFLKRDGYNIINYDLGVFNGEGINFKDKNSSKDVAARLNIRPTKNLLLSGSYYWGEVGENYEKRERYGAGACYEHPRFVVRGEWMGGKTGLPESTEVMESNGWYTMVGFRATRTLMPVVRYESFTLDNNNASATRQNNITAGLTWQPLKQFRFQVNYTYEDMGRDLGVASGSGVMVQLSGAF